MFPKITVKRALIFKINLMKPSLSTKVVDGSVKMIKVTRRPLIVRM